jgi:hypothetical protein
VQTHHQQNKYFEKKCATSSLYNYPEETQMTGSGRNQVGTDTSGSYITTTTRTVSNSANAGVQKECVGNSAGAKARSLEAHTVGNSVGAVARENANGKAQTTGFARPSEKILLKGGEFDDCLTSDDIDDLLEPVVPEEQRLSAITLYNVRIGALPPGTARGWILS